MHQHIRRQLFGLCAVLFAGTLAAAPVDDARTKGAAWLIKQQRGDGSWSSADDTLPVQTTALALQALGNAGLKASPSYGAATSWLANADADSVDSIARKTTALAQSGMAAAAQSEADKLFALRSGFKEASWGGYGGNNVEFSDTALALAALRLGDAGYPAKAGVAAPADNVFVNLLCTLVTGRIAVASGKSAWPMSLGASGQSAGNGRPSVAATAALLSEIRAMQLKGVAAGYTCSSVTLATLATEGQAWLLDQQNADGGFGEQRTDGTKGTSNVLVSALAFRTLSGMATVPQPAATNAQNWLISRQNAATGNWGNDPLLTATVLTALQGATAAYAADTDKDGITDVVEQALGSNQAVADSRNQLGSPSLATPGVTITSFAANGTLAQGFTYALTGSGSFVITAGSLPPGLTLNPTTGQITGTPTQEGSFSFDYQAGSGLAVIGRIDIAGLAAAAPTGDVPLPLWAIAALGGAFVSAIARRTRTA